MHKWVTRQSFDWRIRSVNCIFLVLRISDNVLQTLCTDNNKPAKKNSFFIVVYGANQLKNKEHWKKKRKLKYNTDWLLKQSERRSEISDDDNDDDTNGRQKILLSVTRKSIRVCSFWRHCKTPTPIYPSWHKWIVNWQEPHWRHQFIRLICQYIVEWKIKQHPNATFELKQFVKRNRNDTCKKYNKENNSRIYIQ